MTKSRVKPVIIRRDSDRSKRSPVKARKPERILARNQAPGFVPAVSTLTERKASWEKDVACLMQTLSDLLRRSRRIMTLFGPNHIEISVEEALRIADMLDSLVEERERF